MVIGIAGGSCSGKSTLAARLGEAYVVLGKSVEIIGLDRFYTRDTETGPTLTLSDGTVMFNFNDPRAIDADSSVSTIYGAEADVVIVEGLFTLAIEPIRMLLTNSIYVHLDADLRAIRRLLRDMKGGRMTTEPEFIARYYIESARVGHTKFVEPSREFANLVVVGDDAGMAAAIAELSIAE